MTTAGSSTQATVNQKEATAAANNIAEAVNNLAISEQPEKRSPLYNLYREQKAERKLSKTKAESNRQTINKNIRRGGIGKNQKRRIIKEVVKQIESTKRRTFKKRPARQVNHQQWRHQHQPHNLHAGAAHHSHHRAAPIPCSVPQYTGTYRHGHMYGGPPTSVCMSGCCYRPQQPTCSCCPPVQHHQHY